MEYNGGSVVAMVGKNCVAIASDLRLGNQALTVATNFEKVSAFCIYFEWFISFGMEDVDASV
jgi:20S proteasome alpha/beta subunit